MNKKCKGKNHELSRTPFYWNPCNTDELPSAAVRIGRGFRELKIRDASAGSVQYARAAAEEGLNPNTYGVSSTQGVVHMYECEDVLC
jgi:hypothetical protein